MATALSPRLAAIQSQLDTATATLHWAVADREPMVAMMEFGNNSVNREVGIWMDDPWDTRGAS